MSVEQFPGHPETIGYQPSVHGELQMMSHYADKRRFSDAVLKDKYRHFNFLKKDPEVSDRAKGDIDRILGALAFEITMRKRER